MSICWINETASHFMRAEADRAYPNETGGVLVGYIADTAHPVIVAAIGPGPNARHYPTRFFPDHDWQCEQLDELYKNSDGLLVYLGDWHTHPDGKPNLSWLDRKTIHGIAKHTGAMNPHPLMMIGGGSPKKWHWLAHQYYRRHILGLLVNCLTLEIQQFNFDGAA